MRTARVAVTILLGLGSCGSCGGAEERDLWVVNNSGAAFSVAVDGKEVLPTIASTTAETSSPSAPQRVKVKPGDRTLEARFADGSKVVRRVMFSQQTSGYVFAPRRAKTECFFVGGADGETGLDRDDEVLGLPHVLDEAHTLRMKPCVR